MKPERRRYDVWALLAFVGLLLTAACGGFEPPEVEPPATIEYPVAHYRFTSDSVDFVEWRKEVKALRKELRVLYPSSPSRPSPEGGDKEDEFLDLAVDPASIIWREPAAFWREPVILSWWELIDETGSIEKVVVITSNQTPAMDARIIAWCLKGKTWKPGIVDGEPTPSLRSASINLGESKWHISYWQKLVSAESAAVITVVLIAIIVRFAASAFFRRPDEVKKSTPPEQ